ncbi:MAG: hypothetical protein Q7R88_00820 [bacterium]|nr:hypothetical protein [bacterium]
MSPAPNAVFDTIALVTSGTWWAPFLAGTMSFIDSLRPYSIVFSLLFFTGIVYCFLRIERIVEETYHADVPHEGHGSEANHISVPSAENPLQKRFERIKSHMESEKESDWRLAVLEADVMLDEMISGMGYRGDSLGEKLKAIEKSDFTTLEKAWEAHVIRNRIAHEGALFPLTHREARRVIGLYEEVFKEFQYI